MNEVSVSFGLAFVAGLVSFLSPCVLPLVPSSITFVTGMTLDELATRGTAKARRHAAVHASLFVLGFGGVFMALGATASAVGSILREWLPLLQRTGGVALIIFGLLMIGVLRFPMLLRDRRFHLAAKPSGMVGSLLVGVAFGAGWTPCVGPVLASILLYAGADSSMSHGTLLLGSYALGLGIPFWIAAVGLNWYLSGARHVVRWVRPIEVVAGSMLVLIGTLLLTGHFVVLSRFLAGMGQLITLSP